MSSTSQGRQPSPIEEEEILENPYFKEQTSPAVTEEEVKMENIEDDKTDDDKTNEDKTNEDKTNEDKKNEEKTDEDKTEEDMTDEDKTDKDKTEEDKTEEDKTEEDMIDEDKTEKSLSVVDEEDEGESEEDKDEQKLANFKKLKAMNFAMMTTFKLMQDQFSEDESEEEEENDKPIDVSAGSDAVASGSSADMTASDKKFRQNTSTFTPTFVAPTEPIKAQQKASNKISKAISKVKSEVSEAVKPAARQASAKEKESIKTRCCNFCNPKTAPKRVKAKGQDLKTSKYFSLTFYKNNPSYMGCFAAYFGLSIFFVIIQMTVLYPDIPWYTSIARGAAILIYFNTNLVILTVLRKNVTWFRNTEIGKRLTFIDEFIEFHKFMGIVIFVCSWIHTVDHFSSACACNYKDVFDNVTNTTISVDTGSKGNLGEVLFWTHSGVGWIGAGAAPTGWILLVVICIMVLFAMPFIRRNGYFNAFYFTHKLYYAWIIVNFFHSPRFWYWFIGPCVLWLVEIGLKVYRKKSEEFGETYIKDVNLLSSKVTHLVITRPKGFSFRNGDYMFIKIPDIAKHEWHPFTISSATELKDEIWVHVRSLGTWTNRLHQHFTDLVEFEQENVQKAFSLIKEKMNKTDENPSVKPKLSGKHSKAAQRVSNYQIVTGFNTQNEEDKDKSDEPKKQVSLVTNKLNSVFVPILLDGPYGTASGRIFDSEHAVLIAGGIGVTPFASILQSLWFQHVQAMKTCTNCAHQWYDKHERKTLRKVDFVWVNRDFEAFEWFVELLAELELQQTQLSKINRFLTIHLYMTSAKVVQEIKTNIDPGNVHGLKNKRLLNEILKESNKNFRLKLIPGRPKFNEMFKEIKAENKGKIDVYFCGAPKMGQDILKNCKSYDFNFQQENF